jgi:nitrile hydratase accessory protein
MSDQFDLRAQLCGREPQPWNSDAGILFGAPWQAQAFAMTVALNEAGHFSWADWAAVFSEHREKSAALGVGDDGDVYFQDWLAALEEISSRVGLAPLEQQSEYQLAWDKAAHRTPHGAPIALTAEDFRGADHHHK